MNEDRSHKCPYGCAVATPPGPYAPGAACAQCGGLLKDCPSCRWPNRTFARHCRNCRNPLALLEGWPCLSGGPSFHGSTEEPAPFVEPTSIQSSVRWTNTDRRSPVPASCLAFTSGTLVAAGEDGSIRLIELATGREIHHTESEKQPLSLLLIGEKLVMITRQTLRVFELLDPRSAEINRPHPTRLRLEWEQSVHHDFESFTGTPVALGSRVVLAMQRTGAMGLMAFDVKERAIAWSGDAEKTLSGEHAFLTAMGGDRVVTGDSEGRIRGFTAAGHPWFETEVTGGLLPGAQVPFPAHGGRLHLIARDGSVQAIAPDEDPAPRPVGQIHVELPGAIGVSRNEIVIGTIHGKLLRYNVRGLEQRMLESHPGPAGNRPGFHLPPRLYPDGQLVVANAEGALHFLGPRSMNDAPTVKHFSFRATTKLTALIAMGSTFVGVSQAGEIQALEIEGKRER